ncbi:MAG: transporter [Lachnospiraceae bacterium]|nr:transporter [Lachnospiraceae bacterium]
MKYNYNHSDENSDQVEMSQRLRQDGPGRPGQDGPGRPGQDGPGRPRQDFRDDFEDDFPGGPPEGLPPGLRVRPPQGPPPSIPGGMLEPPRQDEQRGFGGRPGPGYQDPFFPIDPRGIRRCLYRFTFVWLRNGNSFWFYPVYVAGQTVIGFRWRARGWDYYSLNLRRVSFYRCF